MSNLSSAVLVSDQLDDASVDLRFNMFLGCNYDTNGKDCAEYFHSYDGKILVSYENGEDYYHRIKVGEVSAIYFNVGRIINDRNDAVLLADSENQEMYDYISEVVYNNEYKPKVKAVLGEDSVLDLYDVLLITYGVIDKDYRGHNIMLKVLKQMVQQLGYNAVTVIKPFPLQFSHGAKKHSRKYGDFPENEEVATKKLQKYYSRVGFKKLRNSPYMVITPDHLKDIK